MILSSKDSNKIILAVMNNIVDNKSENKADNTITKKNFSNNKERSSKNNLSKTIKIIKVRFKQKKMREFFSVGKTFPYITSNVFVL